MSTSHDTEEAGASGTRLSLRQQKRRLLEALRGLKDASAGDYCMAAILLEVTTLENALAFVARLDRSRRYVPPPLGEDALLLPDLPPGPHTRESLGDWVRSCLPRTASCLIWPTWRERKDTHPVVYLRGIPVVAYWFVFEAVGGQVPPGRHLELTCGEYRCVNPVHLRLLAPAVSLPVLPDKSCAE